MLNPLIHLLPCGVILVLANLSAPTEKANVAPTATKAARNLEVPADENHHAEYGEFSPLGFFLETKLSPVYYMCMDGRMHEVYGFSKW